MPLSAIGLLLFSAALHTTWNLLLKGGGERYMASWWAMMVGSLLLLPRRGLERNSIPWPWQQAVIRASVFRSQACLS